MLKTSLNEISHIIKNIAKGVSGFSITEDLFDLKRAEKAMVEMTEMARDAIKQIDHFYKQVNADLGGKDGREKGHNRKTMRILDQVRENLKDSLKSFITKHGHAQWLLTKFPDAKLVDVEGLVKLVHQKEMESNDWSLTPGRYVGFAQKLKVKILTLKKR